MTLNIANLDRLISHLKGLPEERFNMRYLWTLPSGEAGSIQDIHKCGTAACIAGWVLVIAEDLNMEYRGCPAAHWLGINGSTRHKLFLPDDNEIAELYPLSRAIRTLKHMRSEYLRTGEVVVDWNAPESVALTPWTAPKAVELKADLPAEITRFLGSPLAASEVL
jgi:hypothetical protein